MNPVTEKVGSLVKGNTVAQFVCYRDGELWYSVHPDTDADCGAGCKENFDFPVPINDTGTGIFPAQIKASTLMRWIRKHIERMEEWQKSK